MKIKFLSCFLFVALTVLVLAEDSYQSQGKILGFGYTLPKANYLSTVYGIDWQSSRNWPYVSYKVKRYYTDTVIVEKNGKNNSVNNANYPNQGLFVELYDTNGVARNVPIFIAEEIYIKNSEGLLKIILVDLLEPDKNLANKKK